MWARNTYYVNADLIFSVSQVDRNHVLHWVSQIFVPVQHERGTACSTLGYEQHSIPYSEAFPTPVKHLHPASLLSPAVLLLWPYHDSVRQSREGSDPAHKLETDSLDIFP